MRGASALGELLARYPAAKVRVLVVWEPVIPSDLGPPTAAVRAPLARDPRVVEVWDPTRSVSARAIAALAADARAAGREPPLGPDDVVWDVVAVYPAGAVWREPFPLPPLFPDGPVEANLAPVEAQLQEASR